MDVIFLKNLLSEVSCILTYNNINMKLEKWGGRGRRGGLSCDVDVDFEQLEGAFLQITGTNTP